MSIVPSPEYWEGINAADRGIDRASNPYSVQTDNWRWSEWDKGWEHGGGDDD
ncbi:MAG: hypothetical protein KF740_05940 [Ramlibacter sp.]|nr:hypothetical protein [Ramlibacter sp.]